ncbi:ion channel [Brevundimonas sp. FT23028]|uniref:ion channel n=1 Tax=Brevundimonas sp. FT23028 TaxID=3393748 RepID=UPI003B585FFF
MLIELVFATVMVVLTVVIHGAGLLVLSRMLRALDGHHEETRVSPASLRGAAIACLLALGLLTLHGLEIWLYGLLYLGVGAIEGLRDAIYFSTISYASIGYSDAVVDRQWRLLGGIEGVNGALLLGWSIAFFVTVMTRFMPPSRKHRQLPP